MKKRNRLRSKHTKTKRTLLKSFSTVLNETRYKVLFTICSSIFSSAFGVALSAGINQEPVKEQKKNE